MSTMRKQIPEYRIYLSIKNRCYNKNASNYKDYGGRGIKVCDRWLGEKGFENFLNDMGKRPEGSGRGGRALYSIDRINNNDNYRPENCRWTTNKVQQNNKRSNHIINGKTLSEWGEELGGSRHMVRKRLKYGWSEYDATHIPFGNPNLDREAIHRANQRDITYNGRTQSMKAWARETGIPYTTIAKRIESYGWDEIRAITTPRRTLKK